MDVTSLVGEDGSIAGRDVRGARRTQRGICQAMRQLMRHAVQEERLHALVVQGRGSRRKGVQRSSTLWSP
ncbi:MAG: hypothetical protein ABGY24_07900, partial [bacterium]